MYIIAPNLRFILNGSMQGFQIKDILINLSQNGPEIKSKALTRRWKSVRESVKLNMITYGHGCPLSKRG